MDSRGRGVSSQACRARDLGECEAGSTKQQIQRNPAFPNSCVPERLIFLGTAVSIGPESLTSRFRPRLFPMRRFYYPCELLGRNGRTEIIALGLFALIGMGRSLTTSKVEMANPNASCNLRFSFDSVFIIFLEASGLVLILPSPYKTKCTKSYIGDTSTWRTVKL